MITRGEVLLTCLYIPPGDLLVVVSSVVIHPTNHENSKLKSVPTRLPVRHKIAIVNTLPLSSPHLHSNVISSSEKRRQSYNTELSSFCFRGTCIAYTNAPINLIWIICACFSSTNASCSKQEKNYRVPQHGDRKNKRNKFEWTVDQHIRHRRQELVQFLATNLMIGSTKVNSDCCNPISDTKP